MQSKGRHEDLVKRASDRIIEAAKHLLTHKLGSAE
jgi:hypothetical protein